MSIAFHNGIRKYSGPVRRRWLCSSGLTSENKESSGPQERVQDMPNKWDFDSNRESSGRYSIYADHDFGRGIDHARKRSAAGREISASCVTSVHRR